MFIFQGRCKSRLQVISHCKYNIGNCSMTFSKANQRMVFILSRRTRLSDFTFNFHFHALEKEMATHLCSCLENPRGRGAWWAAIYGVAQSRTRLRWLSNSSSRRTWMFTKNLSALYNTDITTVFSCLEDTNIQVIEQYALWGRKAV